VRAESAARAAPWGRLEASTGSSHGSLPPPGNPDSDRTAVTYPPDTGRPAHPGGQPPAVPGQTIPGLRPGGWFHYVPVFLTSLPQQAERARSGTPPLHSTSRKTKSKSRSKTETQSQDQDQDQSQDQDQDQDEVPRAFRTVHPIGWIIWKGENFAPTEEELLT
jgi:hypothetical protein